MSDNNSHSRNTTPELRMLWYPHLPDGCLSPEKMDEAMRRGRQERAQMLAAIMSWVVRTVTSGASALFRGIVRGQVRRANTALAQARAMLPPEVMDLRAAARGELPGPVCEILSHPESLHDDANSAGRHDDPPRLAA